jgi:DNA (cytosine-5)-methyltransferase 1
VTDAITTFQPYVFVFHHKRAGKTKSFCQLYLTTSMPLQFIDLFAGIGGFHQAIQRVLPDSECVLASDIDKNAQGVYEVNYEVKPVGDIREIPLDATLPTFSLLCAGFPCQSFSAAGRKQGFDDPRGTLFFDILKLVDQARPTTLLFENVANLVTINEGKPFETILKELTDRNYNVTHCILSPHQFGIPQSRDRVYIVASREKQFDFSRLAAARTLSTMRSILDTDIPASSYIDPSTYVLLPDDLVKRQPRTGMKFCGYIRGELRKTGVRENTEHLSRVHKQTARIHSVDGNHPTLSASETSGRYHIYDGTGVRKLTLSECYRLMDYPDTFTKHSVKGSAYRQIGNSVCVKVIEEIIREMVAQEVL